MFEIGNSLREERLRQGLDFPQIEQIMYVGEDEPLVLKDGTS